VSWSYVPETASTLDQTAWTASDHTGTLVRSLRFPIFEKNRPSRAMANGTRALERMAPFRAPNAEITKATATSFPPYSPRNVVAALDATGSAARYRVELLVATSSTGRA
jgi:hypothetical protein